MRIGIIGCGIAGQASAIALARDGHAVTVVERFAAAEPRGAGLLLQPSGLIALERLGLREAAEHWGAPVAGLYGRTVRGRAVMDLRYGKLGQGIGIHRAALFKILNDGLPAKLVLNFEVKRIDGDKIIAADGRVEGPFDLILDCAGAHDGLRNGLGARVRDPIYPWGALWIACADRSGQWSGLLRQVYDRADVMMGVLPIGRRPGCDDQQVAFFWSVRRDQYEATKAAGLEALKARMVAVWPDCAPLTDEIASFDQLSFATYRDVHMKPWRRGRVLVLGDAAHGTSPQVGQGANLAVIDAITLAHALRKERDVETALALCEKLRRPHLRYYQWASYAMTPVFQSNSRLLAWMRDAFLGPMAKLPVLKPVMLTTLAGFRLFPIGLWTPPD